MSLIAICLTAFAFVFVLLITLALVIRLISVLLPEVAAAHDVAVVAAIGATVASMFPGARVTRMEEER